MNGVNIPEIVIVNSIGVLLMIYLRMTRIDNMENRYAGEKLFDILIWITIGGCLTEMLTFLIDGRLFPGGRVISYLTNSLCFLGTCSVGFLWCLYVDFRIYNNIRRMRKIAVLLVMPLIVESVMLLINLSGAGLIFTVSESNVYQRGSMTWIAYLILFFYFFYSIATVKRSGKNSLYLQFFPVFYFVVPCMVGTIVQGMLYGISVGWTSVAIAFLFVHIQIQARNSFVDSLSGLFNRRYLDCILSQFKRSARRQLYGIMIDVNDFKKINDAYGHSNGDDAIRSIGRILSDSVTEKAIAIRYAGDEFMILVQAEQEEAVLEIMERVERNLKIFNVSGEAPYTLSFAMGYSRFDELSGNMERFLAEMDEAMYTEKQRYYEQSGMDRRRKREK